MTINKRFFAFGCSYTKYSWLTWADIIGVNFDLYKNVGRAGASNLLILSKFIEVHEKYKFGPDDLVIVMFTGWARFSYIKDSSLNTQGELRNYYNHTKNEDVGKFLDSVWSEDLGVYNSWLAVKTIKTILDYSGTRYKLMSAIDISDMLNNPNIYFSSPTSTQLAKDIYDTLDIKESFDERLERMYKVPGKHGRHSPPYYSFENQGGMDGHPTIDMHKDLVQEYFPEFITKQTLNIIEVEKQSMIFTDSIENGKRFGQRLSSYVHSRLDESYYE